MEIKPYRGRFLYAHRRSNPFLKTENESNQYEIGVQLPSTIDGRGNGFLFKIFPPLTRNDLFHFLRRKDVERPESLHLLLQNPAQDVLGAWYNIPSLVNLLANWTD